MHCTLLQSFEYIKARKALLMVINSLQGDNIILEVLVKFIVSRSQQTVSVKGQIVNILGFVGHIVSVLNLVTLHNFVIVVQM